jgi:hypothetical protein
VLRLSSKAAKCYVYLADVSAGDFAQPQGHTPIWETQLRKSRWFSRGWTLQELLAPNLVEFFESDGKRLGDKKVLEPLIHAVTGITKDALQGSALSNFSIEERKSWAKQRNTKLEEDEIYSLLGLFSVSMSPIYGEGRENASRRLSEEIHRAYKGVSKS